MKVLNLLFVVVSTMILTSVFDKTAQAMLDTQVRYIVNEGGTWSSKTMSILQVLDTYCVGHKGALLVSVVSESFPHLRIGAMRDYEMILGDRFSGDRWGSVEHLYSYPGGAQIEFFSADQSGKAHGPRRDVLFLNEAINIPKSVCDQLTIRTRWKVFIDHNPCGEYWVHELRGRPDVAWIHSTYRDAMEVVPFDIVKDIETWKERDPNRYRVYGLGEVGNVQGLVHPNFSLCDDLPAQGDTFYGLDFGFTNDPTALVKCVLVGEDLYCDQLIYESGLTNDAIARRFDSFGIRRNYDEVYADCAEPKSITEISRCGYNVKPAVKGVDSLLAGIQRVNQYRQHWTKRSVDAIKEQRNYRYVETSDGKITNKPVDDYNHAMDARRYAVFTRLQVPAMEMRRIAY